MLLTFAAQPPIDTMATCLDAVDNLMRKFDFQTSATAFARRRGPVRILGLSLVHHQAFVHKFLKRPTQRGVETSKATKMPILTATERGLS